MKVKLDIRDYLALHCGPQIEVLATIDIDELIEVTGIPDEFDVDIHELLEQNRVIAHLWSIEDVQEARPDLNGDQAWEVLKTADRRLDSEHGINCETIEIIADELFGGKPECWRGRIDGKDDADETASK